MAIKAAVIEKDSRFLDRLTAVFAKNYADKLEIYPYTDPEVALSTLEFVTPDILIADESIRIAAEDLPAECALAYFVSSVGTDRVDGHRAICKFQRAELIYKQIAGIVSDRGDSKFVTFSSPAGGVGVTTAAAAFALRVASKGHSVLYLDLNAYGSPSLFFRGKGEYRFGDVLHTLIHKDANLTELLFRATRKDPRGVSFFCESEPSCVYPSLDAEAISRLLRELRILASFDYIVVDIPFELLLRQRDLWESASATVLLADATEQAQSKLTRGYHALLQEGFSSELCLLTNRCNSFPMRAPELSERKDLGQIPVLNEDGSRCIAAVATLDLFDTLI